MNNIMPLDKNLNPVPVLPIGTAQDITDGTLPSGASRIIRITAVTDCRLWQYRGDKPETEFSSRPDRQNTFRYMRGIR